MKDISEIRERKFAIQNYEWWTSWLSWIVRDVGFSRANGLAYGFTPFLLGAALLSCWHARFCLYVFLYFFQCILCLPNCTIHRLMRRCCTNLMHRWLVPSNFFRVLSPWSSNRSVIGRYIGSTCSTCSFVFTKTSSLSIIGAVSAAFCSRQAKISYW